MTELNTSGQYTVKSIVWEPDDGSFKAGKSYKAVVEVEAKAGYTFDGLSAGGITHNASGIKMEPGIPDAGTTKIKVTLSFGAAGSGNNPARTGMTRTGTGYLTTGKTGTGLTPMPTMPGRTLTATA